MCSARRSQGCTTPSVEQRLHGQATPHVLRTTARGHRSHAVRLARRGWVSRTGFGGLRQTRYETPIPPVQIRDTNYMDYRC